ncbi:MAG: hypothetical protein AAF571_05535 [Verrucomicrobiota bacterium]
MKYLTTIAAITISSLIPGCSKSDEDALSLGLIVENPSHQVIVWLNDDPVKVFVPGQGGPVPLRLMAQAGKNNVRVTVENPSESGELVAIDVMEGSWFEPDQIKNHFHWETSQASDMSPVYQFSQDFRFGSDRSGFSEISLSKDEALNLIREQFTIAEEALRNRDTSLIGLDKQTLNQYMAKIMNVPDFYERVFEVDDYEFETLCSVEDLDVVVGKSLILGYNRNGGGLFRAGPLSRNSNGKMIYRFGAESISLGLQNGRWIFVY